MPIINPKIPLNPISLEADPWKTVGVLIAGVLTAGVLMTGLLVEAAVILGPTVTVIGNGTTTKCGTPMEVSGVATGIAYPVIAGIMSM